MENFYFENTKGNHSKFWAVLLNNYPDTEGNFILTRRWGKIGEAGRTMEEKFFNLYHAERRREALIREKEKKGYEPIL